MNIDRSVDRLAASRRQAAGFDGSAHRPSTPCQSTSDAHECASPLAAFVRPTLWQSLSRWRRAATPAHWCVLAAAVCLAMWAVPTVRPVSAIAVYAAALLALIAAAAIDTVEQRLPDELTLSTVAAGFATLTAISLNTGAGSPWRAVAGGAIFAGWILLGALPVRDGYGLGDVKLAAACGILTAWLSWTALALAIVATQLAIVTLLLVGRSHGRQRVPLGPTFVIGIVAALLIHVA